MNEYGINLISVFLVLGFVSLIWLAIFAGDPIPNWWWWYIGIHAVILIIQAIYKAKHPRYF